MKILMTKSWNDPEYLDDGMLYGLRSLFGEDVVEYPRMWHMYADSFTNGEKKIKDIAARGFTYYGRMTDNTVDRTDIESKIRNNWFDIIIMHPWYPSPFHNLILETTSAKKIVWLDGRDETKILDTFVNKGLYFKRELTSDRTDVLPISFGFPDDRIQAQVKKINAVAPLIPGRLDTYIYFEESEYYMQYNQSLFGLTKKKNGWDCLRHYEILGSQCIPWFVDIAFCPPRTCTTLPKDKLLEINRMLNQTHPDSFLVTLRPVYDQLHKEILEHFSKYCTTEALGRYVIDAVMNLQK